jgi:monoterpene epsilon-lactone hydrolase
MKASRREFAAGAAAIITAGCAHAQNGASASGEENAMTASNETRPGIQVPARFIPTPTSISPQAQAFLSHPPPVEAEATPALDDIAGWRAHAERANRGLVAFTAMMARNYAVAHATHQLSSAPLYEITPQTLPARNQKRAILYVHGGGFMMGGGDAARNAAVQIAGEFQMRTFSLDYRMPPDHPFPAALDDAVEAYRWLLARYKPENIAIYGPSAGGNLAPAMILKARDLALPLPGACVAHSPASDMTHSGDTFQTNDTIDIVLRHAQPGLSALYAGGHDPRDPLLSPAFADYSRGFPPTIITSGTRDLLLSCAVMLHRAMRKGNVKAELHVWEAMTHAPFFGAPEERELYAEQVRFVDQHLGVD